MKYSFKEIFQYKMDKILSKGTFILVSLLILISSIIIIIIGVIAFIINQSWSNGSSTYSIWKTMNFLLDSGNLASEESSVAIIGLMALVTLIGIFFTSILIGIINNGIQDKILDLRKGNSRILEKDHIVIIGYDEAIFSLLSEVILANENKKNQVVVLLTNEDKLYVEEQLHQRILDFKTTTIIVHSGNTSDLIDIEKCSIETSKSIIINQDNDFDTLKTTIAVATILERNRETTKAFMIIVVHDKYNIEVAKIASKGFAEVLYFDDIISRIIAQTTIQPGLSRVYTELFNYDGDEIYIESFPELVGKKFSEAVLSFENSTVIGIRNGICKLNPDKNTIITDKDSIILIAGDDGVSFPITNSELIKVVENSEVPVYKSESKVKENVLVLGTNRLVNSIVTELSNYLGKGSVVSVVHNSSSINSLNLSMKLSNVKVETSEQDIYNPEVITSLLNRDYSNVLILNQENEDSNDTDSHTILLLLHLRNIIDKKALNISITTEMKSIINQKLMSVSQTNDFVVSQNLISLMVTQIADNRDLIYVFTDLLDEEGSEIYIKPALNFIKKDTILNFRQLSYYLMKLNIIIIGYKKTVKNLDKQEVYVYTNPSKSTQIKIDESIDLIVLSES